MRQEPYTPPQADLISQEPIVVPEEITKKIKNAWIAGLVSIALTIIFTILSMTGTDVIGLDASAFIDVGLMIIFTFGIYKNSRVCAVLMLLLFAANKIIMWLDSGALSGLPLALLFLWFYTQGVVGTLQYHRYIKTTFDHTSEPVASASVE